MAELGEIVGQKYRLVRKLGEGGMGTVYEAVDERFGGRVALKFIHPELAEAPDSLMRFRREAEAAATAGHQAIVGIFDFGVTDEGAQFLVMELLDGQSLNQRLNEKGNLGISETAYIGCQTLSGLYAAHRVGVIHRDLKPDNIFLVDTGTPVPSVKLLDFGTSLLLNKQGLSDMSSRLTREGTVIGTPEYMCPEQARGKLDLDERADIYSMGLILYECMTGRPPFIAPNPSEVLFKLLMDEPESPRNIRPDIPESFETLIMWAIRKDRESRPRSSEELFNELVTYVEEPYTSHIVWPTEDVSEEAPTGFETFRVEMPENITDIESLDKFIATQTESHAAGSPSGAVDMTSTIPIKTPAFLQEDAASKNSGTDSGAGDLSSQAEGSGVPPVGSAQGAASQAFGSSEPVNQLELAQTVAAPLPPTGSQPNQREAPTAPGLAQTTREGQPYQPMGEASGLTPIRHQNPQAQTMVLPKKRESWDRLFQDRRLRLTALVLVGLALTLCLVSIILGIWLALR